MVCKLVYVLIPCVNPGNAFMENCKPSGANCKPFSAFIFLRDSLLPLSIFVISSILNGQCDNTPPSFSPAWSCFPPHQSFYFWKPCILLHRPPDLYKLFETALNSLLQNTVSSCLSIWLSSWKILSEPNMWLKQRQFIMKASFANILTLLGPDQKF